jgi:CRISPR type III-A-associated protein Csm2
LDDNLLNLSTAIDVTSLIDVISKTSKDYGRDLSSSQLRNIFAKVLTAKNPKDMQMLRPKLIYAAARNTGTGKKIIEEFERLASLIQNEDQVNSYKVFMESFVAYQKFYHPTK